MGCLFHLCFTLRMIPDVTDFFALSMQSACLIFVQPGVPVGSAECLIKVIGELGLVYAVSD